MAWCWLRRKRSYVHVAAPKRGREYEPDIHCDICAQHESVAIHGQGLLCETCWETVCRVAALPRKPRLQLVIDKAMTI
jgi:hypothetical protein